ncbi:MAG: SUMF1/EgtB/PvdO family nonheme iron enzyme [Fibrobacteres bacterium]|nr:SUMF1/EgtB/PvdO family nonheme iron enzyme [Fibrobacterota bacterium]
MNDPDPKRPAPAKPAHARRRGWIAVLVLLLALLLLLWRCDNRQAQPVSPGPALIDSAAILDSLRRLDSLDRADSLARSLFMADSLRQADSLRVLDSLSRLRKGWADWKLRHLADSLRKARRDSLARLDSLRADSLARAARLGRDTIPPHAFADPAAGVHPSPVEVAVLSDEGSATPLCGADSTHLKSCLDMIRVVDRATLWIAAVDTAGNRSIPQRLEYVVDPDASRCGPRRVLVAGDSGNFCLDAFEYPNQPSGIPRSNVSWEEANALCLRDGKRLCSEVELETACRGPKGWRYPYGDRYIPGHCQDVENALVRGMAKPACRSWWGAFHLTGNAWEWSSTRVGTAALAVGGTFVGGPEDRCGRTTRSFYAQNKYESVGFRCCGDVP